MQLNSLSHTFIAAAPKIWPATFAVILASGPEDSGKRATLAFAAACTAQMMDLDTIVFLLGDGAHWAYEGTPSKCTRPAFRP